MQHLTDEQRTYITDFLAKWKRIIIHLSYQLELKPKVTADDIISQFEEHLCVFVLNGGTINQYGSYYYIEKSLRMCRKRIMEKSSYELVDFSDSFDEENKSVIIKSESRSSSELERNEIAQLLEETMKSKVKSERNIEIIRKYFIEGYNESEISDMHGITRQRVSAVVKRYVPNYKKERKCDRPKFNRKIGELYCPELELSFKSVKQCSNELQITRSRVDSCIRRGNSTIVNGKRIHIVEKNQEDCEED